MGRSPFLGVIGASSPGVAREKSLCQSPLLEYLLEGVELFGLQLPAPDIDLEKEIDDGLITTRILADELGGNLPEMFGVRTKNTFLDLHESELVDECRPRACTDSNLSFAALSCHDGLPSIRCEKTAHASTTVTADSTWEPSEVSDVQNYSIAPEARLSTLLGDQLSPRVGLRAKNTFLDLHEGCPCADVRPRASSDSALLDSVLSFLDAPVQPPQPFISADAPANQLPTVCSEFVMKPTWCYVDIGEDGVVGATAIEMFTDEPIQDLVAKVERHSPSEKVIGMLLGPLSQYDRVLEWKGPSHISPTTLILENLPLELTQADFVEVLDREGFSGLYDFVFVPTDIYESTGISTGRSCGYAVVNVAKRVCGEALAQKFQGRVYWGEDVACSKPCKISWSRPLQGLLDNVRMYRNHPLNDRSVDEDSQPQVFVGGFQVPFPKPSFHRSSITTGLCNASFAS